MQNSQGDLAILSAEVYAPGLPVPSSSRSGVSKRPLPDSRPPPQNGPKKRTRTQSSDKGDEGEEAEKKRSRGRPRLDVTDETAADRRRTQIRLAQRAYRNRKENAIQTLEKRVQELTDANEEMSNVFLQLHDFAVSSGALTANPELGRQLRETTEKFLSLARKAGEDGLRSDEAASSSSQGQKEPSPPQQADDARASSPENASGPPETNDPVPKTQPVLYGGFTVTHEPLTEADMLADFASGLAPAPATPALDFEVITQPTLENASFPFGTTVPEFNFSAYSNPSPFSPLPLPKTYTSFEATLGRRLFRFASERALLLISMPSPPPERFNRVFGFSLLIESREAIHSRLRRIVSRNIQESLNYWQFPFYNLGGAGTHFDVSNIGSDSVGNHGGIDILKPQTSNGFTTGPFTPSVVEVQEDNLDPDMRMGLPGFRGDFFDCDEVEVYLRQRGVDIPAGADYVTVEADLPALGAAPGVYSSAPDFSSLATTSLPETTQGLFPPATTAGPSSETPVSTGVGGPGSVPAVTTQPLATTAGWDLGGGAGLIDPLLNGVFSSGGPYVSVAATASSMAGFAAPSPPPPQSNTDALLNYTSLTRRTPVRIDVNLMITRMTERARCLGRTPGFRPEDVNAAFWKAMRPLGL
ncbi:hypothetical protein OQA88_12555 [Cercophora sp. LCS_1]